MGRRTYVGEKTCKRESVITGKRKGFARGRGHVADAPAYGQDDNDRGHHRRAGMALGAIEKHLDMTLARRRHGYGCYEEIT